MNHMSNKNKTKQLKNNHRSVNRISWQHVWLSNVFPLKDTQRLAAEEALTQETIWRFLPAPHRVNTEAAAREADSRNVAATKEPRVKGRVFSSSQRRFASRRRWRTDLNFKTSALYLHSRISNFAAPSSLQSNHTGGKSSPRGRDRRPRMKRGQKYN